MAMGMWVLTALGIKMCVYVDNDKEEREREREKIESNTRKTKLLSDFVYLFVFT